MSKSALIVFAIISVIGVAGGSWMLSDGACSGLDECTGIRNCAKSESCSAAFFSAVMGVGGIIVTVHDVITRHMKR